MPDNPNKLIKFFHELKRRKVVGVIIAYAATAFILLQLAPLLEESLHLPEWFDTLITILLIIGFPIAIIFSWIFDVSSKGLTKTEPEPEKSTLAEPLKSAPEKSIIVLPFENISSDPEQEYFSDGLTEEIITDLSYINDLLVISRSSAMTFKGTGKKIKEIAHDVNVRYVLEGSVRKSGNDLRIVAQLIDSSNDSHIWAEKYTGKLDDIFEIQEKVSRSIANELKIKLSPVEKEFLDNRPIDNAFAYDCYMKAYNEMLNPEGKLEKALNLLNLAIDKVGENAIVYAGIAVSYFHSANYGNNQEKNIKKSEEWLDKSLKIDPELAEAHFVKALLNLNLYGNQRAAIQHFKIAIKNKPSDPDILSWFGFCLSFVGKCDKAMELLERAIKIDPFNVWINGIIMTTYFFQGYYDKALNSLKQLDYFISETTIGQLWKSVILLYNDKEGESLDFLNLSLKETVQDGPGTVAKILKCALKGEVDQIALIITEEYKVAFLRDLQLSWHLSTFYAWLNDKDNALIWLENAVNRGFINYPFLNEHDPLLENIRREPRFKKLMQRVKTEWENFEV